MTQPIRSAFTPAIYEFATHRLEETKVELDQCWDLLRQRDALREFGQDPNEAKTRPASVVERYKP